MPTFEYNFPAIRGVQAGREYYVSMCPLRLIPRIFLFDEDELRPELRAQRVLNKNRVPEIARYILGNKKGYTFSALTASIDGKVQFEPLGQDETERKLGRLRIPMDARFVINDGQHRRAGIEAALRENPDVGDETISVVFFVDAGLRRCQQMFADLNRYAIRPTRSLLAKLSDVRQQHENLERAIKAVPDDKSIQGVAEQLREAAAQQAAVEAKIRHIEEQEKSVRAARGVLVSQQQKLLAECAEKELGGEDAVRMANLCGRTRETVKEFLRQATAAKIHRLSTLITESFRFLLRKKTLVQQIHIDPEDFAVRIFDDAGHAIPKRRLSEGEKQIFAISVLWGLARASERSLPAIIDTPMARLDVTHRNHLVQRYFPHASHQVVILSTDTEVDRRYYDELAPYVSRAYHLNYDEARKVTVAEEGYFWARQAAAESGSNP